MSERQHAPDLCDPSWSPSDQDELDLLQAAADRVAWEKAMAAQGIMVLTLGLTPEQERERIEAWRRANTRLDESFER